MGIQKLHTELVLDIVDYLDVEDLCAVRLSHRFLDRSTFSSFARKFFRKKGFMITTLALDTLQAIAAHEQLRKYVEHVWFNPDCFTFLEHVDRAVATEHFECLDDHDDLIHSDQLEMKLTAAFKTLPNLRAVGMRRGEWYAPFGWWKVMDKTGSDPRILGRVPSGPAADLSDTTYLFVALIRALEGGACRLERLYTDAVELDSTLVQLLSQKSLEAACGSLLYVELNVVRAWLKEAVDQTLSVDSVQEQRGVGHGLSRILQAMPRLKELGLQVFPDRKQSHLLPPDPSDPGSWRVSYPYLVLQQLVTSASLNHLTRVKLEKVTTVATSLQKLLTPAAASLRSLKLRDMRLLTSGEVDRHATEQHPWHEFFAFLASDCPALEYVLFFNLSYTDGKPHGALNAPVVRFPSQVDGWWRMVTDSTSDFFEARGHHLIVAGLQGMFPRPYQFRKNADAIDDDMWHTDTSDEGW